MFDHFYTLPLINFPGRVNQFICYSIEQRLCLIFINKTIMKMKGMVNGYGQTRWLLKKENALCKLNKSRRKIFILLHVEKEMINNRFVIFKSHKVEPQLHVQTRWYLLLCGFASIRKIAILWWSTHTDCQKNEISQKQSLHKSSDVSCWLFHTFMLIRTEYSFGQSAFSIVKSIRKPLIYSF